MANNLVKSHSQAVDLLAHALDTESDGGSSAAEDQEVYTAMSHDEWALTKQVGELIHHADQRCSKQLQFEWTKFAAELTLQKAEEKGYDLSPVAKKVLDKVKPKVSDAELQSAVVSIHAASQSYQSALIEFRVKEFCPKLQANVTSVLETLDSEIQAWEKATGYSWHEQMRYEKIQRLREIPSMIYEWETMADYVHVPEVTEECKNVHEKKNWKAGESLEVRVRQRMSAAGLMLQELANDCSHLEISAWLQNPQVKQVVKCTTDLDEIMEWAQKQREAQLAAESDSHQDDDGFLLPLAKKVTGFDWGELKDKMPPLVKKMISFYQERIAPLLTRAIKHYMKDAPKIIKAMKHAMKDATHLVTAVSVGAAMGGPAAALAWVHSVAHLASRFADNIDIRKDCLDLAKFFDETESEESR